MFPRYKTASSHFLFPSESDLSGLYKSESSSVRASSDRAGSSPMEIVSPSVLARWPSPFGNVSADVAGAAAPVFGSGVPIIGLNVAKSKPKPVMAHSRGTRYSPASLDADSRSNPAICVVKGSAVT